MLYPVTPTLSVEAFQARLALDDVVPVARRLPGVLGACVSPPPPPPPAQLPPLILQLVGLPEPLTMNPKLVDAPTASVPLYSRFVAVTCVPDWLASVSQNVPSVEPAGRSNSTRHDVVVA